MSEGVRGEGPTSEFQTEQIGKKTFQVWWL